MSKLFIENINQYGSGLTRNEVITILNDISKQINKKFKNLEHNHKIKIKLEPLPVSNNDAMPRNIAITTMVNVKGPLRGSFPIQTVVPVSMPVPTIVPAVSGVPLSPFGPVLGVPGYAINPFGSHSSVKDKITKIKDYLDKYTKMKSDLEKLDKLGGPTRDSIDKTYFDFVDLTDPAESEIKDGIKKIDDYLSV